MPAIEPYYEIDTPHAKLCDALGDQERSTNQTAIDRLMAYYDGDHDKRLKVKRNRDGTTRDPNVVVNLVGQAADDVVDFVGAPSRMELPGGETVEQRGGDLETLTTPAQAACDMIYEEHRDLMRDVVLDLLTAGHAFAKIHTDPAIGWTFDIVDPRFATMYTNIYNPRQIVFYRLQWVISTGSIDAKSISLRQDIVPLASIVDSAVAEQTLDRLRAVEPMPAGMTEAMWVIVDWRMDGQRGTWEVTAVDWWEHEFAPLIDRPVKRQAHGRRGTAILKNAPNLNDAYNFTLSNIGEILYYHGHPRTMIAGATLENVKETSVDGVWVLPPGATANNLEMQSDLSSSMNYATMIRGAFFTKAQTVDSSGLGDKVGQLTNFGLRLLYHQMYDLGEKLREAGGALFADALYVLQSLSSFPANDKPVPVWDDPLPVNRLELLQAAQIEAGLGTTSKQTLANDLGRDFEKEQEQMEEEGATASELMTDLLANVSQRFGTPAVERALPETTEDEDDEDGN